MMQKILITGGTGFIGGHLIEDLAKRGYQVLVVPRKGKRFKRTSGCNVWILVAGLMGKNDFASNLKGNFYSTVKFVTAMKGIPEKIVYLSSIDVYGHYKKGIYKEGDMCLPDTYYAVAKLATENFLRVYCEETGIKLTILRLSQVYGPGDRGNKVIPKFVNKIKNGQVLDFFDGGVACRQYIYISDVVSAVNMAVSEKVEGIFNIAGKEIIKIKDIVSLIESAANKKAIVNKLAMGNIEECLVSSHKSSRSLGFKPKISFAEGIALTVKNND